MTPEETQTLKPGDRLLVISEEPIIYFGANKMEAFQKGDIIMVGSPPTIPKSPNSILIKLPQGGFHAAIHRDYVELYKQIETKICTCDVWVTGCKCGVFQAEMDAKRGQLS